MDFQNKKTIVLMLFFSCMLFVSCNKTERRLVSYIRTVNPAKQEKVTIDLKKAMCVDYDCAYLFYECTTEKDIEAVLGIPYRKKTYIPDSKHKLILLKNKEIVYDDSFYYDGIEFFFSNPKYKYHKDDVCYLKWHDSIFVVTLKEFDHGGFIYQLQPIAD